MENRWIAIGLVIATVTGTAQDHVFPAGLIYGPKAAFAITAPTDWVLDNQAGRSMGLHCVLYLANSTWAGSAVVMYAKVASPQFTTVRQFTDLAWEDYQKDDPPPVRHQLDTVLIDSTYQAEMFSYIGGLHESYEHVGYIQVPNAVCYIVFSARNKEDLERYGQALLDVVRSFAYRPEFIGYQED